MSISKETNNKPGDRVSVYQLQSALTGLLPQLSGNIINVRIWYAQVMVDHLSDLTYVHLMISTSQEYNLSVKAAFEIWAFTFGVKIYIYHADNGRFF